MTPFNPANKKTLTYGEALGPAMEIKDEADAKQYFEKYVEYQAKFTGGDTQRAAEICKTNLGYYAGYYSDNTRKNVEKLFACAHPIFGKIESEGPPLNAFEMGKNYK